MGKNEIVIPWITIGALVAAGIVLVHQYMTHSGIWLDLDQVYSHEFILAGLLGIAGGALFNEATS